MNFRVPTPYCARNKLQNKCMHDLQRVGVYTSTLAPVQELFSKNGGGGVLPGTSRYILAPGIVQSTLLASEIVGTQQFAL